jgi:hypothetical protein
MHTLKTGDLIALLHPNGKSYLKTGLVITDDFEQITIKWITYNKYFFMEKEGDIFKELNNSLLLGTTSVSRDNNKVNLSLLSSS